MMPLAIDSFGGVGNNPWNKPASPTYHFDAPPPGFKIGDPLDDSLSSSSGEKGERQNPSRYKTELCRPFEENGACKYGEKCQFAHGRSELRNLNRHPKYKTELCRTFHTTGICPYGPRCHFLHAEALDSATASTLKSSNCADSGILLNNNNNLTNVLPSKNYHHHHHHHHQSFISRSDGINNVSNGVFNSYVSNTENRVSSSSISISSASSQRPSNLNLSLCLNGGGMTTEGEISPPSATSSFSGCSPLIPSLSSSSSVWGPSPAPMSPSSTISSFSSSSASSSASSSSSYYPGGEGSVVERPTSPASSISSNTPFLNVPGPVLRAPFSAPPPQMPSSASFEIRPNGVDFSDRPVMGDGVSPPPGVYTSSTSHGLKKPSESLLNPAAEAWNGGSRNNAVKGDGTWNEGVGAMKRSSHQPQQSQQSQLQNPQDLMNVLGSSASFDQLSKMIVNELLERLKEMIAGQMSGAPPQIQQQALLEQIQALLSGGTATGGQAMVSFSSDDAAALKSLRGGMRDRWVGNVDVNSLYHAFDQNANLQALSSKCHDVPVSAPISVGALSSDLLRPEPLATGEMAIRAPSVGDVDDQEASVRLPIFSQLTK